MLGQFFSEEQARKMGLTVVGLDWMKNPNVCYGVSSLEIIVLQGESLPAIEYYEKNKKRK